MNITLNDIFKAYKRIKDVVFHTPTYFSRIYSNRTGGDIYLKLECFQPIGAFKIRGAANKITSLTDGEKRRGLVTASSGNHGLAVAYVANINNTNATVFVPENAVEEKVKAIESYGAKIVKYGRDYDEAYMKALSFQKKVGAVFIHSFNDPLIIAGQGTIGLELIENIPDLDTIIVPIGGGGLISGISIAVKSIKPSIKVIGVQAEGAPSIYLSWKAGRIVETKSVNTVADGLAARKPLNYTFKIIKRYVDDIVLVSDEEIGKAVVSLLFDAHILAEPSAAASLAALLYHYQAKRKEKIALIISGGNISGSYLTTLLSRIG